MDKNSYESAKSHDGNPTDQHVSVEPAGSHEIDQTVDSDQFANKLDQNYKYLSIAALDLARKFSAGATMWSFAPNMSAHAYHVAVEFVHPVIMGKRALPALALISDNPADELRQCARKGDIFVGIGPGDDPALRRCMLRAQIYGLTSIWIAAGPRPEIGSADHVIWLDENPKYAGFLGHFVLIYHLLWELTHVCFEHPGLLKMNQAECSGPTCITCSDQGVIMEVIDDGEITDPQFRKARGPDGIQLVDIGLTGGLDPGDVILVHGRSVISILEQKA